MYYLGIDIGGTKCAVVLGKGEIPTEVSGDFIIDKIRFDTIQPRGWRKIVDELLNSASEILERNGINAEQVIACGISCGGPLDSKKGTINCPPNLPDWDNVPIVKLLSEHFGVRCVLHNDANACAVAEWRFGAGRGYNNVVFLTFGTGMGAGLILDGRLYSGTNDGAGEVGHVRLSEGGPVGYGKAGSFEGFCSGGGIRNLAILMGGKWLDDGNKSVLFKCKDDLQSLTAKSVAEAMYKGDEFALAVYEKCAEKLGLGLSVIIDILNPEAIVIGSIFERNQDFFVPKIKAVINREALSCNSSVCEILPAQLGDSIGDYASLGVLF